MNQRRVSVAVAGLLSVWPALGLDALTPLEARGRAIFRTGQGGGAPIMARLGATGASLPASSLVCADCHGRGGRGSLESGVAAPDIRWELLAQPALRVGPSGRQRPAYDLTLLRRAIATGRDAGGHPLHVAMPNYQLEDDDFEALAAYLRALSRATNTGVTPRKVTLLLALPGQGAAQPTGAVIRRALEQLLVGSNAPQINGRTAELQVIDSTAPGGVQALVDATEAVSPLAVVAPLFESPAAAQDAERAWAELGAVVIGPVRAGTPRATANEAVFELVASLNEQLRTVRGAALTQGSRVMVVLQRGSWADAWRRLNESEPVSATDSWTQVEIDIERAADAAAVAAIERLEPENLVLLADPALTARFLPQVRRANWGGTTLTVSSALDPQTLADRAHLPPLAVASSGSQRPADIERRAAALGLCQKLGFNASQAPACLFALDAAAVTQEALRRAGRDITADGLKSSLVTLQRFPVPSGQNITFSATRRDGAREVHLTSFGDQALVRVRQQKEEQKAVR